MEVSMVATEVTMASVRLTLMPTPSARFTTDSLRPMPTLLAIPTMSELSPELITDMVMYLDMELSVTVAMLAMEAMLAMVVSMVATEVTMASVRLTLMPTPSARFTTDSLRPMPTPLAIPTMSESSLESAILVTEAMLDTEVTLDTVVILDPSTDKCLPGHSPENICSMILFVPG